MVGGSLVGGELQLLGGTMFPTKLRSLIQTTGAVFVEFTIAIFVTRGFASDACTFSSDSNTAFVFSNQLVATNHALPFRPSFDSFLDLVKALGALRVKSVVFLLFCRVITISCIAAHFKKKNSTFLSNLGTRVLNLFHTSFFCAFTNLFST